MNTEEQLQKITESLKQLEDKVTDINNKLSQVSSKVGMSFKYTSPQSAAGISVAGGIEQIGRLLAATVIMIPSPAGQLHPQVLFVLHNDKNKDIAIISADQCMPVEEK